MRQWILLSGLSVASYALSLNVDVVSTINTLKIREAIQQSDGNILSGIESNDKVDAYGLRLGIEGSDIKHPTYGGWIEAVEYDLMEDESYRTIALGGRILSATNAHLPSLQGYADIFAEQGSYESDQSDETMLFGGVGLGVRYRMGGFHGELGMVYRDNLEDEDDAKRIDVVESSGVRLSIGYRF